MNEFLKTRNDVDISTKYLQDNGLQESGLSCKNWEIASVIPYLKDGDLCDLGSSGSVVLENAVKLNLKGRKVGVDLAYEHNNITDEIELYKGNLMSTMFNDEAFDIITCLSVIEHEINFDKISKECGRLLRHGSNLFISFDFWQPKPDTSKMQLYSLSWNILDKNDVLNLVEAMKANGLELTGEIDWTTQDAVINKFYCAPCDVEYSFGILNFIKK